MFFLILGLLLLIPVVELYVIAEVAGRIGLLEALVLLVAISVAGAWLVKREGLGLLRRLQEQVRQGRLPTADLLDGVLLLTAGALMLVPGFITDIVGLLLLIPFVRAPLRLLLVRRYSRRLEVYSFAGPGSVSSVGVYDVEVVRERPEPGARRRDGGPPELAP